MRMNDIYTQGRDQLACGSKVPNLAEPSWASSDSIDLDVVCLVLARLTDCGADNRYLMAVFSLRSC